jgi:hypothetical protein
MLGLKSVMVAARAGWALLVSSQRKIQGTSQIREFIFPAWWLALFVNVNSGGHARLYSLTAYPASPAKAILIRLRYFAVSTT